MARRRRDEPRLRLDEAGEDNQLRHRHLLRLVPRQAFQQTRDGLVTERK